MIFAIFQLFQNFKSDTENRIWVISDKIQWLRGSYYVISVEKCIGMHINATRMYTNVHIG